MVFSTELHVKALKEDENAHYVGGLDLVPVLAAPAWHTPGSHPGPLASP